MVLRSLLATTVCSLPVVGSMAPDIITRYAIPATDDCQNDVDDPSSSSSLLNGSTPKNDPESAKFINEEKPNQKILNSILSKRQTTNIEHLNSDTDDCMINLQPIHKLADLEEETYANNCGKYEVFSEVHESSSGLVCSSQDSVYDGPTLLHLNNFGNGKGAKRSTKQNVENYLMDQNCKFDELISRNLNNVLDVPEKKESTLIKSAKNVANMGNGLVQYLWSPKSDLMQPNIIQDSDRNPSTDLSYTKKGQTLRAAEETDMNMFRYLLQDMNPERKRQFYEALCEDMEIYEDAKDMFSRPPSSSPSSDSIEFQNSRNFAGSGKNDTLDHLQSLTLLSVRFSFLAMRLVIPVTLWLVRKFTSNDLYIFNKDNFNKFLVLLVKFLNSIERRINGDAQTQFKDEYQASNFIGDAHAIFRKDLHSPTSRDQDEGTIENVLQDFSNGATDFIASKLESHANNSWKGKVFSYIAEHAFEIKATTKDTTSNYKSKPEYAQYFSRKEHHHGDLDIDNRRFNDKNTTLLHAAEVFAKQLE